MRFRSAISTPAVSRSKPKRKKVVAWGAESGEVADSFASKTAGFLGFQELSE
jgi:hypothetical protein